MTKDELKRAAILETAFDVVSRYGFKRTTMDDIANAAGMSRPALYLFFRNKTAIIEALMVAEMQLMRQNVAAVFATGEPVVQQVANSLVQGTIAPMRKIIDTPHGAEFYDLKNEVAKHIIIDWMQTLESEIGKGLQALVETGRIDTSRAGLSVAGIAALLVDAAEGIKTRGSSLDAMELRMQDLALITIGPLAL